MRRLIFINRFFFPDHSATSQLVSDLAFHLAGTAREVHIVTSRQLYDAPKASLPEYEIIKGVRIHRVSSTQFGRGALLGRSVDYLSFYRSVWRRLMDITQQGDTLVAKTDPPLVSLVAAAVVRQKAAGLIHWVQDLYPELAVQLRVHFMRGPVAAGLAALRNRSLLSAQATVVVGQLMSQRIQALGIEPAKIHLIPNWCDDSTIQPRAPTENPLRQAWGLEGKFVLGYSGNLGRAHEYDTVLAAAELLRNDPRIIFLMIGGGKRFEELATIVKARALTSSFRFKPYQDRKTLALSLGAPDLHWLSLKPALEGLIVPSKFYGIAAAGKPIIVIGDRDGELAQLTREHRCGLAIRPGDGPALARAVSRFSTGPDAVREMGFRARKMLDAHFTRRKAFERWCTLLDQL
jgi:colanic acid biosynthesis glycosyl transferase WcaI